MSQSLLKLMFIESVMLSNHFILCHPLLLLSSVFPSIRVYSNESALCIWWPSFGASASASVLPMNVHGEFPFRIDWFDLAVQGTLKSLFRHHSSKASILQHSAFFMVQLSHPCMITGKIIALTKQTFVGKVISLLFNVLSRSFIAFLPRSKRFFCCCCCCFEQASFYFMSSVTIHSDFGAQENKMCHYFQFFPFCLP